MNNEDIIERINDLLWDYVVNYVETADDAKTKLSDIAAENNFPHYNPDCGKPIEKLVIQDSEDFTVIDYEIAEDNIVVSFEMIFIALVTPNGDGEVYHIEGTAVGTLTVPSAENFDYEKYDFDSHLSEHYDIIKNIDLNFEDVEYMGE